LIGGSGLFFLIAFLVVAQAWASGITSQASASRLLFGMARDGRLPHKLFCYLHPARRTPIYSVLLMGGIACLGGLVFDLDQGAELVNFGACLGFMAVNVSVLAHYFVRLRQRGGAGIWVNLICPILGFAICFYIWLSISPLAMRVGAVWTALGIAYLAVQTGGFKQKVM
jgi:amino acid transporter